MGDVLDDFTKTQAVSQLLRQHGELKSWYASASENYRKAGETLSAAGKALEACEESLSSVIGFVDPQWPEDSEEADESERRGPRRSSSLSDL